MPNRFKLLLFQVSIALVATLWDQYTTKWYPTASCTVADDNDDVGDEPSIRLEYQRRPYGRYPPLQRNITFEEPCGLFSMEYVEARSKFRHAVSTYPNAQLYQLPIDVTFPTSSSLTSTESSTTKNDDIKFTIDVAVFPGSKSSTKTIFHSSGLHGVEGFVGSAIQLALLRPGVLPFLNVTEDDEDEDGEASSSSDRPTLVLIHAINPVGMHQHRRFNEHNVDLNRNCFWDTKTMTTSLTPHQNTAEEDGKHEEEEEDNEDQQPQTDFFTQFVSNRDPNIASYEDFRSFLAPDDEYPKPYYQRIGLWLRIGPKLLRYGYTHLKRAMVSGQYHHPRGLFFGGTERQPSITKLIDFLQTTRPDLFYGTSVSWIDVHSGLGPSGKDSLYCEFSQEAYSEQDIKNFFPTAYRSTIAFASAHDESDAFSGYDLTSGGMTTMLRDMWEAHSCYRKEPSSSPSSKALFVVQEFGTLPGILVGRGLILDNMMYHSSPEYDNGDQLSYRSPFLRDAFYPQSADWRSSIIQRGVSIVLDAIAIPHGQKHQ